MRWCPARPSRTVPAALFALALCTPFAQARAEGSGPYGELQIAASGVRHSDLDFVSPLASLSAGIFVRSGIGVELFADAPLERGEDGRFAAGVDSAYGVALRLRSPSSDGLHGYLVLGAVAFTVVQESLDDEVREIEEEFTGARVSIGLAQRLERLPGLLISAEYRNYYVDEAIQVDGLVLGLRMSVR